MDGVLHQWDDIRRGLEGDYHSVGYVADLYVQSLEQDTIVSVDPGPRVRVDGHSDDYTASIGHTA